MRILFITPYPPSRIRVRSYGFVQHLRRNHDITILTQASSQQERHDIENLQQQGYEVRAVSEPRQLALLRSGLALFTSSPLQVAYGRSGRFLQEAQQLSEERHFDVIHVEHLRGMASMEALISTCPVIWDAVDCISDLWRQTALDGPSLAVRMMASLEYKRTSAYETYLKKKLAHIVTISDADRQSLSALTQPEPLHHPEQSQGTIVVIPNGVDLDYFSPGNQDDYCSYNLVYSGKMSYHANIAAAQYLFHQIMPLIWQARPEATLTIVGSRPPRSIQRFGADPRVEVTGYVDDMRPYIRRAHVMISPTVYSAGLQNKVLEAMALGTPTIISAPSARALGAHPHRDMLVATSTQEYAQHALHLMNDRELRARMRLSARQYVECSHNWHAITERLVDLYHQAISTPAHVSSIPYIESLFSSGRNTFVHE